MTASEPPLHLVIIGAGLCGLVAAIATRLAGHSVTVLESVAALHEVGAGLQLTPNGTNLLEAWGVTGAPRSKAAAPEYFRMRRFSGELLAERPRYAEENKRRYKSPLWCLHRADLQKAMAERASEVGVVLLLGHKVNSVDWDSRAAQKGGKGVGVSLDDGSEVRGDIVLAAAGVWSKTRQKLLDTGSTLRGSISGLISDVHAVAYSIKGGKWLNLVLLVKDDLPEAVMKMEGDLAEMKAIFREWDPILTKLLGYVKQVEQWRLNHLEPLPFWKSESGTFLLAGDCAHPMLPYMARGANSSLEDGATIGALLSKVQRRDQVAAAMTMYDQIRRPWIDQLVRETFEQGKEHHLHDGPEQAKRDGLLSKSFEMPSNGNHESSSV